MYPIIYSVMQKKMCDIAAAGFGVVFLHYYIIRQEERMMKISLQRKIFAQFHMYISHHCYTEQLCVEFGSKVGNKIIILCVVWCENPCWMHIVRHSRVLQSTYIRKMCHAKLLMQHLSTINSCKRHESRFFYFKKYFLIRVFLQK